MNIARVPPLIELVGLNLFKYNTAVECLSGIWEYPGIFQGKLNNTSMQNAVIINNLHGHDDLTPLTGSLRHACIESSKEAGLLYTRGVLSQIGAKCCLHNSVKLSQCSQVSKEIQLSTFLVPPCKIS